MNLGLCNLPTFKLLASLPRMTKWSQHVQAICEVVFYIKGLSFSSHVRPAIWSMEVQRLGECPKVECPRGRCPGYCLDTLRHCWWGI